MFLNEEEKRMLEGKYGPGTAKALDIIVKWGEVFGAEKLVDVSHTHTCPGEPVEWLKEISEGARARTYSTLHTTFFDLKSWAKQGIKGDWAKKEITHYNECMLYYNQLGLIPSYTCCPNLVGNIPLYKSNTNFHGSENVLLVNSLFGARNPRVGGPGPLLSAITGKAPFCSLIVDENRYGEILFEVDPLLKTETFSNAELGAFGYFIGLTAKEKVCVVNNLKRKFDFEAFKSFVAPMATSGAVALCHIIGVTPDAQTLEQAFGKRKPIETVVVGKKEIEEVWKKLNTTNSAEIDLVILGCPHLTIPELKELAKLLEGRRLRDGKRMWLSAGQQVLALAAKMGLTDPIEKAGVLILTGVCNGPSTPWNQLEDKPRVVATNSAKAAHYIYTASGRTINVRYGNTEDCINSVLTGRFENTGRWIS
jgi:predicted aconitase